MTEPSSEPSPDEHTIDELSALTRVPSRTIRYYQSKGVLPAPRIRGRVAYYGKEHEKRLELIAQLQDRGLRIDAIRELLARVDKGEVDVGEWLGLEAQFKAPWAHDQPRSFTEAEMAELLGKRRVGLLADLVRTKVLERRGDTYLAESPALLKVALDLESAGVDPELGARAADILRKHLAKAAKELAELFVSEVSRGHILVGGELDLARFFEALRPSSIEAVRVVFGREMERVLRHLVESGQATKLSARRDKRR